MKRPILILLKIASVLLVLVYVLSWLTPYVNPSAFWPLTFIALTFPVIAACMIVSIIAWLFFNRRIALLLIILFFGGYKNLSSVFASNLPAKFQLPKEAGDLRIVSWNVRGFNNNAKYAESPDSARRKMINFLKAVNADVLLLQEYVNYDYISTYSNTQMLHDSLGYKYFYTSKDRAFYPVYGPYEIGSAIFSRVPLLDTSRLCYDRLPLRECAITADILYNKKRIRLMTTHLISMNLRKGFIDRTDEAFKKYDSAFIYGTSRFTKLMHYDSVHSTQALQLKKLANASPYPVIITGDFNATPSGFTYHTIRGNLQDAFLKKGAGIGRSYSSLSPTLRIDYVLVDELFKVKQYNCPKLYLSDHFPLVTDLTWMGDD